MFTVVVAVVTHRIWRMPKTDMGIGDVEIFNYHDRKLIMVSFKVSCSPRHGSFVVKEAECRFRCSGVDVPLLASMAHIGQLFQGGYILPFSFEGTDLAIPKGSTARLDMRVKLHDGSEVRKHVEKRFESWPSN